ncbi:MAG: capsule assembly Wzi family protein [Gammaproteobacteria bacterium]|jgi:hypothetical protein
MRWSLVAALSFAVTGTALARGVSPYLPLHLSPEIERQVERVLLYADVPLLTRPIAAATVFDALPQACERDPAACTAVRNYLAGFMRDAGISHAGIELAATSDDPVALPNRRGMPNDSAWEVSAQYYWQPADRLLLSAGFIANEDDTYATGSLVSVGFEYFQLDAGFRDHWFSPMSESSMLIGTQAQTMPSLTVSNYTPLTRWNFRYELFLAEMSASDRIRFGDGFTAGNPRLAGMHLSLQPLPGFTIGINRIMQFGGGERGGNSLGDIFDAFFDPSGADNFTSDQDRNLEFGNQAASITARFMMPTRRPFSVYFEYAGEDTSTARNTRLGNVALSAGLHFLQLPGDFELTVELSDWQNAWYTHGIYQDGLVNEGNVIGHWGADYRVRGDAVGARSIMARIGWQPRFGGWLEATWRSLENDDYTAPQYERADILEVLYSRAWRDFNVGIDLTAGNDSFGESFSRFGTFIRF